MKIVIIGSGNVATVLGNQFFAAGHSIVQVVARRQEAAAVLAREWSAAPATEWAEVRRDADCYLVSISDKALPGLAEYLQLPGRLVVHTAGAASLRVLTGVSERCGVLYPLQSLRSEVRPFPRIPLLIDAVREEDLEWLARLAGSITDQVQRADDGYRLKCHVAAVAVNNFGNFLYTLTDDFCAHEGVDFRLLLPLIRETAGRLEHYSPGSVQTGPALRGDTTTMERHLEILAGYPQLKAVYELFSAGIAAYYGN